MIIKSVRTINQRYKPLTNRLTSKYCNERSKTKEAFDCRKAKDVTSIKKLFEIDVFVAL